MEATQNSKINPQIEPLGKHHNRAAFSCGKTPLDNYLKHQASQDLKIRYAAVLIMVGDAPETVAGYYTLSSDTIELQGLPPDIAKKLPKYPYVPAVLLGRLAIDEQYQGRGLGEFLLVDALKRTRDRNKDIGAWAVTVDPIDACAEAFYVQYGFARFGKSHTKLYLPSKTIEDLFV